MRTALCLAIVLALQDVAPAIGLVETYGLRHVEERLVRQAVGLKAGDAFPESDKKILARLQRVPGVAEARLEGVCCNDGRMVLFVAFWGPQEHRYTGGVSVQVESRSHE